jgi:hypothetical protein
MQDLSSSATGAAPHEMSDGRIIHGLLELRLASGELAVPLLPEVAIRVVRAGPKSSTNAQQLADIINAEQDRHLAP